LGKNIFVETEGVFCINNSRMLVFEAVIVVLIVLDVRHLGICFMVVFLIVRAIDVVHY